MSDQRTARRIDGSVLSVDLRTNVVIAQPGGTAVVGAMVAEFIEVLLRRYPDPASYAKLLRELYPSKADQPKDGPGYIRSHARRVRAALEPIGFTVASVRPIHADAPSAYRLVRLTPPSAKRGAMIVPPPKGLEP